MKPALPPKPTPFQGSAVLGGKAAGRGTKARPTASQKGLRQASAPVGVVGAQADLPRAAKAPFTRSPSPPTPPPPLGRAELVEKSRRNWLAKLHLSLCVDARTAHQSLAELSEVRALGYLDGTHHELIVALARQRPDWAHLGLRQLCALLEGTSGPLLVDGRPPSPCTPQGFVPLIMVTPPEDAVAAPPSPASYLQRRFAGTLASADASDEATAGRERAWLCGLMDLLRLPTPPALRGSQPTSSPRSGRSSPGSMPASLEEKLEREGVDWQHTCTLELVDLILALDLVK